MTKNTQTTAAVPDTILNLLCGRALRPPRDGRNNDTTKFRQGSSAWRLTTIAILLALCLPLTASRAQNFTTSVQETSEQSWNDAIWEPGQVSPTAGNDYEVLSGGIVRVPSTQQFLDFPGSSLMLDEGARLFVSGSNDEVLIFLGTEENPGLVLNGGILQEIPDTYGSTFTISGQMAVVAPSAIYHSWHTGGFVITAQITGTGDLTVLNGSLSSPLDVQSTNNPYSGTWHVRLGGLTGSGVGSLGTGNISVTNGATLEVDYDIQTPGTLTLLGYNSVMVLHQDCQFSAVLIDGVTLAPGTYSYDALLAQFPGNFAADGSGSVTVPTPLAGGLPPTEMPGYYVDYVGGSDSNVGTNPATAWQHCPGDPAATGTAGSTSLSPGDTVYFKGGENYVLTAPNIGGGETAGIAVKWSGTAGNPITYTSTTAWGTSTNRAIITDNYSANNIAAFYSTGGYSNIVFNNLEIGPIGGGPSVSYTGAVSPGHGIDSGGVQQNVTVENCYFHNIGWFGCCGASKSSGAGYSATDSSYVTLTNCQFYAMSAAIDWLTTVGSSNLTVVGNLFQADENWVIYLPITGGFRDDLFIHGNMFHDVDVTDAAWAGCGIACFHADTIMDQALPYGSGTDVFTDGTNIDIYDNVFYDDTTANAGETACVFFTGTTSGNIYNNLFIQNNCSPAAIYVNPDSESQSSFLVRVYNNTAYNNGVELVNVNTDNSQPNGVQPGVFLPGEVVDQKNNIIYNFDAWLSLQLAATNTGANAQWTMNNDDLFNSTGYGNIMYWDANGYLSFAAAQSYGWEVNGLSSDPQFVALTYTGFTSMGISNDYHLSASSPCIGAGINLSAVGLPGLNVDKDGNPRPASGPWAIGAYQ